MDELGDPLTASFSSGLVASLRREIMGKEQKMQQLKQEVEKVKKENREKDNQLAVVSAKVIPNEGLDNLQPCVWINVRNWDEKGHASLC